MKPGITVLILIMSLIINWGCKQKATDTVDSGNPLAVLVQVADSINTQDEIRLSGNIEGCRTVRLGFMVAGRLNYIAADEGQTVKARQLLASLDPENYSIALDIASANYDQTLDEYDRLRLMHDRHSIAESDFSKVTNALKAAKAQQQLQAKNLTETKLYSPISGVLLMNGAEEGEIIATGMPLFVVSDISRVNVAVSVPESELNSLKPGDDAQVYLPALDSNFPGKVTDLGSVAEPTTRAFTVKIEVKNPLLRIRPGMTAEVRIKTGKSFKHLAIPAEAVLHDADNSSYVFVADKVKNSAFRRNVSLGNILGNQVEVVSGLNNGDLIITSGQQKLSNGASITIKQQP